jgi:transcriptional regulator with GAF, ATPase, and Fis domain
MDAHEILDGMTAERSLTERDLAMGDWRRARRRTARALEGLLHAVRKSEPELWGWLRILGLLARAEQGVPIDAQLALWPALNRDPAGNGVDGSDGAIACAAPRPLETSAMGVITRDAKMRATLAFLGTLAPTELPIIVEGESGTGKEIVARAIHATSCRAAQAFVPVNCGAIPMELQESELFGHARGAYTGAIVDKPGLFEAAHDGTLFLDEIGEMEPRAQVKLLRVLESGEIRRLGEVRTRRVDVRVIAATNSDVDRAVAEGRFRRDLLYRLGAVRVRLPALRERPGDILTLATHFLRKACVRVPVMTPAAQRALLRHEWPGNVRELKFVMERAVALWQRSRRTVLGEEFLMLGNGRPAELPAASAPAFEAVAEEPDRDAWPQEVPQGLTLETLLDGIERGLIARALEQSGGNRTNAARLLGDLSRTTLIGKMKRLGVVAPGASAQAHELAGPYRNAGSR